MREAVSQSRRLAMTVVGGRSDEGKREGEKIEKIGLMAGSEKAVFWCISEILPRPTHKLCASS